MIEAIKNVFEFLKNSSPQMFLALVIASGALLFAPAYIIQLFSLEGFRETQRAVIGLVFLGSAAVLVSYTAFWIVPALYSKYIFWKNTDQALRELSRDEKAFLATYIRENQNSQYRQLSDGTAQGLAAKGIVYRASNLSGRGQTFPFNLQPWAKRKLLKKPNLLD